MIERRMKGKTDEDEHNIAYNNSNLNHKEFPPLVWMLWSLVILKSGINNGDCACLYYMSTTGMCCPFSLLLICWWLSFTWGLSEIAIKRKDTEKFAESWKEMHHWYFIKDRCNWHLQSLTWFTIYQSFIWFPNILYLIWKDEVFENYSV